MNIYVIKADVFEEVLGYPQHSGYYEEMWEVIAADTRGRAKSIFCKEHHVEFITCSSSKIESNVDVLHEGIILDLHNPQRSMT